MFDKLEDLLIRYEEIMGELQEPDVVNDQSRFRKLMKEQNDLTPIVEAYKEYKNCKQNIEDSLSLLEEESDEEMKELAKEELPGIVALYAKASKNAKEAGFDGIELHCAHAYMLLGSFLSPLRNKRTDEYGGSLLNRARLLFEVLDAIKEACGEDFPIVLRMSGSERDPQGNKIGRAHV